MIEVDYYMGQSEERLKAARVSLLKFAEAARKQSCFTDFELDAFGERFFNALLPDGLSFANREDLNRLVSAQEGEVNKLNAAIGQLMRDIAVKDAPIPMRLVCPACKALHEDEGDKPHHTHACQACGNVWRPAIVATVGVRFLPGFKNREDE